MIPPLLLDIKSGQKVGIIPNRMRLCPDLITSCDVCASHKCFSHLRELFFLNLFNLTLVLLEQTLVQFEVFIATLGKWCHQRLVGALQKCQGQQGGSMATP